MAFYIFIEVIMTIITKTLLLSSGKTQMGSIFIWKRRTISFENYYVDALMTSLLALPYSNVSSRCNTTHYQPVCWTSQAIRWSHFISLAKRQKQKTERTRMLSNIALLPFDAPLKRNQWGFNQIVKQAKSENHDFFMKDSMLNDVLCVMPKLDNPRIIRQSGAFFLFGCDEKKSKPATLSIPKYKIQIKKRRKKKILSELDSLGINESTLFPEIENVAHFLLRHRA